MRTKLSLLMQSHISSVSHDTSKEYQNKYHRRIVQYCTNDVVFYQKGAVELFSGWGRIIHSAGKNAYEILIENNITRVCNQCDLKHQFEKADQADYNLVNDLYDHVVSSAFKQSVSFDTVPMKKHCLRNHKINPKTYKD